MSGADGGDGAAAIVVRDTAGRTVTVSPSQESVAEALSDELTSLSHDLTLERHRRFVGELSRSSAQRVRRHRLSHARRVEELELDAKVVELLRHVRPAGP